MKQDSLWYLLIPVALVLVALGVFLWPRGGAESALCSEEPTTLGNPVSMTDQAIDALVEQGVVSSHEEADQAVAGVGWVLDPADDYRLEYWVSFGEGRNMVTAGFEVVCISPELMVVWRYDGLQALPNE